MRRITSWMDVFVRGQCLRRSSMLGVLKLTSSLYRQYFFVLPQSGSVARLFKSPSVGCSTNSTKAFGVGFSNELGTWRNLLLLNVDSVGLSRLICKSHPLSSFIGEKSLEESHQTRETIRVAECARTVWEMDYFCEIRYALYFLFQHLHWKTTDHTFSQHLLKDGVQNLEIHVTCEGVTVSFSTFDLRPF